MASAARGAVRNVVRKCEVMVAVSNRNIIRRNFSDIPGEPLMPKPAMPRQQPPAAPQNLQNLPPAALQVLAHFEVCDSFLRCSRPKHALASRAYVLSVVSIIAATKQSSRL